MISKTLTYSDVRLSPSEVYEALGYHDGFLPDEQTQHEVHELLEIIAPRLCPQLGFVTKGIESLKPFTPGRIIESQLKDCQAVCYFVATAGEWFEQYQHDLAQASDMVKVYIANEIGSLLAEKTADRMEEALEEQLIPKGLGHTNRFSPGYCGWNVSEQHQLFDLLGEEPCGVRLTESALMIPIKSVSGIIGIGKDIKKHDYKCNICGLESCYKRRIHLPKNGNQ